MADSLGKLFYCYIIYILLEMMSSLALITICVPETSST